jgi:hypothetical protein
VEWLIAGDSRHDGAVLSMLKAGKALPGCMWRSGTRFDQQVGEEAREDTIACKWGYRGKYRGPLFTGAGGWGLLNLGSLSSFEKTHGPE